MNLQFIVRHQIITRADTEKVVRDSQNYLKAVFSFSEDWHGTKTAVFKSKAGAYNVLLDEDNACLIPWEVLEDEAFFVSVFCGDLITANILKIPALPSGYEIGEESRTPTEDIFNQIIDKVNAIDEKVDDLGIDLTATVDDTTGTPEVVVTKSGTDQNPTFNLAFSGLKGAEGDPGETGATPQITATASVGSNTGTPSVNVTQSGTVEAPIIDFAFSGLKGETGAAGADGADGVSPEVTIATITGGHSVTITDATHPSGQTFDVMDGEDAELPWVTPQDYGAKADGTTDDTDAIVAAETAANNGSKVLYFPAGTYKVRVNTVRCHSGMTWIGDAGKSIIMLDPTTQEDGGLVVANPGANITVRDLIFRGSETYGSSSNGVTLFAVWNGNNCNFYNCVFQNNKNLALTPINSNNISVINCRFEATDCGIEAMGAYPVCDVTIRGCFFSGISSYNGFKNFSSEPISSFCGKDNTSPNERWIIEDCVFEQKLTNAILLAASGGLVMSDGVINNKDMVIRNCTFRGIAGCIEIDKAENILVDGIFVDDTDKDSDATFNINSVIKVNGSKNVTIRNVTSKCQQIVANPFTIDENCDNVLFDGVDAYAPARTANQPFAIFKGNNITIKNMLAHPIATSNKVMYVLLDNLTDSTIDVRCTKDEGGIVVYNIAQASQASVSGNKFIVDTDADIRRNVPYSTSTAELNDWILDGDGTYTYGVLTSINKERPKKGYTINPQNQTQFDALDVQADFYLMQDGYEFYLEFVASTYSAGKSFSFNGTGNIIPISLPITFSNDYKVVCHFVQKNAKWVEVERKLEYYAGPNVEIEMLSAPLTIGSTTVTTVEDAIIALAALV